MTPKQISLVQETWSKVTPIADQAADIFYDKLFELDAGLRPLFPADLSEQKKKLMQMIGRVVASLGDIGSIVSGVQDLGRRHAGYGVQPDHYATVGSALLDTLEVGLGDAFTDEVSASWGAAYALLSTTMMEAAKTAAA